MATESQIHAHRTNARKSTGPKTEAGEARARLNALTHGERPRTVASVLPQEDPRELDAKLGRWVEDLQPNHAVERELVASAAKTSWYLDRAERCETARLARRVRKAQLRSSERTMERD